MIVSSKTPELRRIVQPLKIKIIFISANKLSVNFKGVGWFSVTRFDYNGA